MRGWIFGAIAMALAACGAPPRDQATPEASASASPPSTGPQTILAVGTEPFWSITAGPSSFFYTDPEVEGITEPGAMFMTEGGSQRLTSGAITLTIHEEPCSDGMSDIAYPMRAEATVIIDGDTRELAGCAWRRWDHALLENLPTIDACLESVASEVRLVSFAGRLPDGSTLVRVGGFDPSEAKDCVANASGALSVGPADPDRLLPGLTDIALFRAPGENPGGACYEAEEVRSPDGALIGWLDTLEGC